MAVFTAFNILANFKFPLNEALCTQGSTMAVNLHQQCKDRLKQQLAEALAFAKVKNGSYIDRYSLARVLLIEDTLPSNGTQRDLLENYVSESPLFDFVYGSLSKEINENQKYNSDIPEQELNQIEEYNDLAAVSERLVETLDSLPWKYCLTFKLNPEITAYLENEVTQISDDIKILRTGNELVENFPLQSGLPGKDQYLHGGGLLGLAGPAEWNEDKLHVQIMVDGFFGKWTSTSPELKAIDALKSTLGLLIAMRAFKVEHSYSASIVKSRFYIHKEDNGWCIDDSGELNNDISKTIGDLRIDDINGHLDTDIEKSRHVRHCLESVSKALAAGNISEKIKLAGQWLFDSYCGQNELLSYIQTTVSLEILLGEKAVSDLVGLGELLRNRCAYLIGTSHAQREEVLSDFKKIYDIRSKIVHRGKSRLSIDERSLFRRLQWIVSRVIQEEVKLIGKNA